jgi:hypothetical protein
MNNVGSLCFANKGVTHPICAILPIKLLSKILYFGVVSTVCTGFEDNQQIEIAVFGKGRAERGGMV